MWRSQRANCLSGSAHGRDNQLFRTHPAPTMGMGMSSMSSDLRDHIDNSIKELQAEIHQAINNNNEVVVAAQVEKLSSKIKKHTESITRKMLDLEERTEMKADPKMVTDITQPLLEAMKILKHRNSNLQETEIKDKEALSMLKDHMNEIQRKFEHHVTHADVKQLEIRVAELEAMISPTRGMSPATLYEDKTEDDLREQSTNSADLIRDIRGKKLHDRKRRRAALLPPIADQSQANKNPYLLLLE